MTPTHTRRRGKLYRYYVTTSVMKLGPDTCAVRRVPAAEIESAVIGQVRHLMRSPEIVARTLNAARAREPDVELDDVRLALRQFDELWDQLFAQEQSCIVQLLVETVDVAVDNIAIKLRTDGLTSVIAQFHDKAEISVAALCLRQHPTVPQ